MNCKEVNEAANKHALEQLGLEQFSKNKHAAKAIKEDFKAGAKWSKEQDESIEIRTDKNMKLISNFIEHAGISVHEDRILSFFNA